MTVTLSRAVSNGEIADVLARIVARRRERLRDAAAREAREREEQGSVRPFVGALRAAQQNGRTPIIAEVKMGSPKLGDLRDRIDPERQARSYRDHGAAALSVVVEPDFFHGSYELLRRCVDASGLPAVAKDFVVSERQIESAARAGASALLLIAALYDRDELHRLAVAVRQHGLVPLVETHSGEDVAKLRRLEDTDSEQAEWELVGVNNRDLRTFEVDLQHSIDLLPRLPEKALRVAESGIAGRRDVERLTEAGFDAFLIGESLLLAEQPGLKLRQLLGEASEAKV